MTATSTDPGARGGDIHIRIWFDKNTAVAVSEPNLQVSMADEFRKFLPRTKTGCPLSRPLFGYKPTKTAEGTNSKGTYPSAVCQQKDTKRSQ